MAPGFFSKLADFGKKVWKGVKKGADVFRKAAPIAQEVIGAIGGMAPPGSKLHTGASALNKGLGFLDPIANYVADA